MSKKRITISNILFQIKTGEGTEDKLKIEKEAQGKDNA